MPENVLLPLGFKTAGLSCGTKTDPKTFDLALFFSETACTAVGVFTQNRVVGAPVQVNRERVPSESVRAVVINSGNANACTGEKGLEDARWMTTAVAGEIGCPPEDVLICSTGVIGQFLPRKEFEVGIPKAVAELDATPNALENAARGMMTTDTFPKLTTRACTVSGQTVRVSGVAKGAAMIGPNMATMLSVIMTDAPLDPQEADRMLRHAVDRSFNSISVDGHTSTSDTVLLLANAAATTGPLDEDTIGQLGKLMDEVAEELACAIIRDAEGADHFITIDVKGLKTRQQCHQVAKTVANSPLVKTAITGNDPNWGRIVSAVGYSGIDIGMLDITLRLNGTLIYDAGAPTEYDEAAVSNSMKTNRDVHIELQIGEDDAAARFWTSDLTGEYVRLNSEYTT